MILPYPGLLLLLFSWGGGTPRGSPWEISSRGTRLEASFFEWVGTEVEKVWQLRPQSQTETLVQLKRDVVELGAELERGVRAGEEDRQRMEAAIDSLISQAPPPREDLATSERLNARWGLVYTTEAELLWLMRDPGTEVSQTLDNVEGLLGNYVRWRNGAVFTVDSTLTGEVGHALRSSCLLCGTSVAPVVVACSHALSCSDARSTSTSG